MELVDTFSGKPSPSSSEKLISAMPMLIEYSAQIFGTYQRLNRNGEPVFKLLYPERLPEVSYPDCEGRDAFSLRDQFLTVSSPTDALNFLREAGDFDLDKVNVTWTLFQRWQAYAQAMHIREERDAVFRQPPSPEERTPAYSEMVRMAIMASYGPGYIRPHKYFGEQEHLETEGVKWDEFTRYERGISETAEGARLRIESLKRDLKTGEELRAQQQRELEAQFVSPVLGSYEIKWGDRPEIVFHPRCALEAIANAIQVDRLAGVRYTRCGKERCRKIVEVGDQKGKQYCNRKCMDAARKQRQRQRVLTQPCRLPTIA